MAVEIGLVARAKALAVHLLPRQVLESLAEGDDVATFVRALTRSGAAIEPVGDRADTFAVERAVGRTISRHLRTLERWEERAPGVLEVFAARQDRRSLRALLRGAAAGASTERRLEGLLPTASLPQSVLIELAHQPSPVDVVRQLTQLAHPDAPRLLPIVQPSQIDLLAVDAALLDGFAERATRGAARADQTLREWVNTLIDMGNAQNAILFAGEPRDVDPAGVFVHGGRWLMPDQFVAAAAAGSPEKAWTMLAASLADSPLASPLAGVRGEVAHLDRAFLTATLQRLTRRARLEPLSSAPLLRVVLLLEAQGRDLRTLAWGAALGTPSFLRVQRLVTPT